MKTKPSKRNISEDWSKIPAGEVFTFIKSYAFSRDNLVNDTHNSEGVGNIHYGDIHSTFSTPSIDLKQVSVPMIKDRSFTPKPDDYLKDGDLIMADASEDYAGVGVTVSLHGLEDKKIVGGLHTFVLRDTKNKTDSYFRQYIFRNPEIRNSLQKVATGVSVYGISKTAVSKLLLAIPSIPEQKRIVSVLKAWDKAIENLTRNIKIKKDIQKGLMQELLTGRTRLSGFAEKWKVVHLGDVADRIKRKNTVDNQNILTISGTKGLVSQSDIFYKRIAANNLENYHLLKRGDFAYNKSYSNGYPMGAIKRLKKYDSGVVSSLYITFEAKEINGEFLDYYFENGLFNKALSMVAQEGARNHGLLNIGVEEFLSGDIHIPTGHAEQKAIADILTTASKAIQTLERKLQITQEQKRYLLNNLITGSIRTPETLSTHN